MARQSKRRNSRPKTNRRYDKSKDKDDKFLRDKEPDSKSGNDPAWYASNPTIMKDAASYPFSYVTGATDVHDQKVWDKYSNFRFTPEQQIPGICSLHLYPCVTSKDATDPINVAAQSVYSFVRHANSGHSNYDAPDLMLYILAMANVYSALVWCERLYGYALTWEQRNRYIPNELIRTNNVDPEDLRNNLANFRFWINQLVVKMSSFAVPATMSVFNRLSFLYSDYYVEGTSIKEQLYQYVPDGFYKFGLDENDAGMLQWVPNDFNHLRSVQEVQDYVEDLFAAIWEQEDFGIMSGDILKAYGDNIIKVPQVPELYNMLPKMDTLVLTQIKNATMMRFDSVNITQDVAKNIIVQDIHPRPYVAGDKDVTGRTMSANLAALATDATHAIMEDYNILTVDTDNPTPEIVMECTRLKATWDTVSSTIYAGTEICSSIYLTVEPGVDYDIRVFLAGYVETGGSTSDTMNKYIAASRQFHYMPVFYTVLANNAETDVAVEMYFDIDNFTVLTHKDLRKMHEAATLNMFAVPSVGKVM